MQIAPSRGRNATAGRCSEERSRSINECDFVINGARLFKPFKVIGNSTSDSLCKLDCSTIASIKKFGDSECIFTFSILNSSS